MNFARLLIEWYQREGRVLPWRQESDPYRVWLSEVILQQTRVEQGLPYYYRFIELFPNILSLANANEDTVLKAWEGLGYYSRARNLHRTAKLIVEKHNQKFPNTVQELQKLYGIGPYTARALASFAFGAQVAVVDGNVFRVLSRVLADFTPVDRSSSRAHFQAIADQWLNTENSALFNQAIMDFGATVCLPKQPKCHGCILKTFCKAYQQALTYQLPYKEKEKQKKVKYINYYWIEDQNQNIIIQQRPDKGIWASLWELPNLKVEYFDDDCTTPNWRLKHSLTHFDLYLQLIDVPTLPPGTESSKQQWVNIGELEKFAFSIALRKLFSLKKEAKLF